MFFLRHGAPTNAIGTNAHMDPSHSPHYKAWYVREVQAALCRAIRGDMYSHLTLRQLHNCHLRLTSSLQVRLHDITSKWQPRTRVSNPCTRESYAVSYTDAHADIHTRRLICLHNFGSCSLCSSSASRRILAAVVRAQMHIPNLAFTLTLN